MARCMVYVILLVVCVCFTGVISVDPVEEDDFSSFLFDEDQDADTSNDDQVMRSPHTLVIPGHLIRKLKINLHKSSESTDNSTSNNASLTPATDNSTDNANLTSAAANSTDPKFRLVRVPHHIFSLLSKYAKSTDTDMSNENTDNVATDMDNTEEGNFEVDGWTAAGKKVRRVPHNIFRKHGHMIRRLKKAKLQKHSTDNVDLTSAMDRTAGQKFRLVRVPHNIFSRLSKYAKSSGTDMSNENTDNVSTDMDNTGDGNFLVDGVVGDGLKVLRVTNNLFRRPGHMIRRLKKAKLQKPSMGNTDLTSAMDRTTGQKFRLVRVPHNIFSRLSKYAKSSGTDMSNENPDNVSTDMDNTEDGNFLVDGVVGDGLKVLRVPNNLFRRPGHMIRRLKKAKLQKPSMENVDLTSAMDRTTGQKFRLIRVPHNIYSRFSKYSKSTGTDMTDISNENNFTDMDNMFPDMDNTEEENFQVDGVAGTTAGLKVLRVPNNIFHKLAKTVPQRLRTAVTDQSLQTLVDGEENSKIRVLNVPRSVYKKLREQYQTALDEESDESSE